MNIYFDYHNPTDIDTNEKAIDNSIRNILLTLIGSVPGKPDFGSRIMEQVFELMDGQLTNEILEASVIQALIKWEPRINILNVDVKLIPEYNRVIVEILYEYNLLGKNIGHKATITLKD